MNIYFKNIIQFFSIKRKTIFFSIFASIALIIILLLFYFNTQKIQTSSNLVKHTQEVIQKSNTILLDVLNIEAGSRGYILTDNSNFLKPYYGSISTIYINIKDLKTLTKDNKNQQLRIDSLKDLIDKKISFTKETLELKNLHELYIAEELIGKGKGKILSEKIREIIASINSEEHELLKIRNIELDNDNRNSSIIFSILLIIIIVILITVYILIVNETINRKKAVVELHDLNNELAFQNKEKEKRAAELEIANKELVFQNNEKEKRAAELIIANKELAFQNNEKEKRAAELRIANKELAFQNELKEKRAAELGTANIKLAFQNNEKEKRAAELIIANKELAFQNNEKEKRAAELRIANKELAFQNEEKEKRAAELGTANIKLAFQNNEKEKRAAELIIANKELDFQNKEKEKRAIELEIINKELIEAEENIRNLNEELEQKVIERTTQLEEINKELETFTYSVSHDLRAPLRAINGYAKIIQEDYSTILDTNGIYTLDGILKNSKKMGNLIDDLLAFSRLGRNIVETSEILMTSLVQSVVDESMIDIKNKENITIILPELIPAMGQQPLIKQVWINLLSNALKYSRNKPKINIEIGSFLKDNLVIYFIKDNGAGFDMQYYDKLFGVFQRLHSQEEFEGTGIGLAIVQKIITRNNGTVWAESKLNEGSCFYFSLSPIIN